MQKKCFFVWSFIHAVVCLFVCLFLSFFLSWLVGWLVGWCSWWNIPYIDPRWDLITVTIPKCYMLPPSKEKTGLAETEGLKLFHSLPAFLYSTWLLRLFNVVYKGIIDDIILYNLYFNRCSFFFEFWTRPQFLEHPFIQPFRRILLSFYTRWWFHIFFMFTPNWGNDPIWRSHIFSNGLKPPTPDAPCMDYLPTLGEKWPHSSGHVGKYSLHGSYGN